MEGLFMKVVVALDQTAAAGAVLAASHEIAGMFAAQVSAVHVLQDGAEGVRRLAADDGVALTELEGRPAATLAQTLEDDDDAVALVVGTRARAHGGRKIGSTALEVVASAHKPVFAIPPQLPAGFAVRRVLVPLEGSLSTSYAPYAALDAPGAEHIDVVILHVLEEHALPAFSDQPQHEWETFAREFLARYSQWPFEQVRLETRVGRPEQHILPVAQETNCDLIALAWAQELAPGRGSIVREALGRGAIPVLLVPVHADLEPLSRGD
jgi:nucleotide-binding universal stress UspA family protein